MQFNIGFGKKTIQFSVDNENLLCVLHQNKTENGLTGVDEVKRALKSPIGTKRLKDICKKGEKIAIITSDITRPLPSSVLLPALLGELEESDISMDDVTVVFALGSHRKHSDEEKRRIVGDYVINKVKCIDSDMEDCVYMGNTKKGTPVEIFRPVAEADRRICLGNIEYHYFAGYSGGAKAIMPGVSTRNAIQSNHSAMTEKGAEAGQIKGNPVRTDIEDAIALVPIDFILNVVLDENKNIVRAVAGHYIEAHREGCTFLDSLYKVRIPEKADIVITTPGGFPKDINLYQSQKALDNSKNAVKRGGIIILAAACTEGLGEKVFERWYKESEKPEDLILRISKSFELGGHKAAAIAMVLKNADVYLVSELDDDFVRSLYFVPFKSVDEALDSAYKKLGSDAGVIVMPHGSSTLPVLP